MGGWGCKRGGLGFVFGGFDRSSSGGRIRRIGGLGSGGSGIFFQLLLALSFFEGKGGDDWYTFVNFVKMRTFSRMLARGFSLSVSRPLSRVLSCCAKIGVRRSWSLAARSLGGIRVAWDWKVRLLRSESVSLVGRGFERLVIRSWCFSVLLDLSLFVVFEASWMGCVEESSCSSSCTVGSSV